MTAHEEKLLEAAEALYSWAFLPHTQRMLGEVKQIADKALRLYESPLPGERARLEREAMVGRFS